MNCVLDPYLLSVDYVVTILMYQDSLFAFSWTQWTAFYFRNTYLQCASSQSMCFDFAEIHHLSVFNSTKKSGQGHEPVHCVIITTDNLCGVINDTQYTQPTGRSVTSHARICLLSPHLGRHCHQIQVIESKHKNSSKACIDFIDSAADRINSVWTFQSPSCRIASFHHSNCDKSTSKSKTN